MEELSCKLCDYGAVDAGKRRLPFRVKIPNGNRHSNTFQGIFKLKWIITATKTIKSRVSSAIHIDSNKFQIHFKEISKTRCKSAPNRVSYKLDSCRQCSQTLAGHYYWKQLKILQGKRQKKAIFRIFRPCIHTNRCVPKRRTTRRQTGQTGHKYRQ